MLLEASAGHRDARHAVLDAVKDVHEGVVLASLPPHPLEDLRELHGRGVGVLVGPEVVGLGELALLLLGPRAGEHAHLLGDEAGPPVLEAVVLQEAVEAEDKVLPRGPGLAGLPPLALDVGQLLRPGDALQPLVGRLQVVVQAVHGLVPDLVGAEVLDGHALELAKGSAHELQALDPVRGALPQAHEAAAEVDDLLPRGLPAALQLPDALHALREEVRELAEVQDVVLRVGGFHVPSYLELHL
mmetsp:Transcript_75004/g.232812  ORF Transcript_75004/g.232812 Transcript_75004/m.232812 type:complete len:243 (-) Transcript_75004:223-951(-)